MKKMHKIALMGFTALITFSYVAEAANADGMPAPAPAPKPMISPLDKAVNDIQAKEPPVMTKTTVSQIETDEPIAAQAPVVPQSRIVEVQEKAPSFFGLSVGVFDPLREKERSLAINAEYQPAVKIAGVLQPLFGAMVTSGSAVMGYAGVGLPFNVTERVLVTPSIAVAAYHNGADYDLGQLINLRAGGEIAYVLKDKSRIGLGGYILTNMDSTSRSDRTGLISVNYTTPTTMFSGKSGK